MGTPQGNANCHHCHNPYNHSDTPFPTFTPSNKPTTTSTSLRDGADPSSPPSSRTHTVLPGSTTPFLSFTQDGDNLDKEMAELCLSAFITSSEWHMIDLITTLHNNVIALPITEFHNTIMQREELLRIKNITTPSLLHSNVTKAAEVLLRERPTKRLVLAGLIQEVTEKSMSGLKRQLKSALKQLKITKQTLQTLKCTKRNPKNKRGSNMI